MYINTFKYTPKDVSCQLCTEYVKKLGCTPCAARAGRAHRGWCGRYARPSWKHSPNRRLSRA
jgi:hypothetical protein